MMIVGNFIYADYTSHHNRISMSKRNEQALKQVDKAIKHRMLVIKNRQHCIDSISQSISRDSLRLPLEYQFYAYKKLYFESHLVTFYYSLKFSRMMCHIADKLKDANRKAEAQSYHAYSMCRGGFFKEAVDSFMTIKINESTMPDSVLAAYYLYGGRAWHDLADYTDYNNLSLGYKRKGNSWLEKALKHIHNPSDYNYVKGKMLLWMNQQKAARPYYVKALHQSSDNDIERKSILYSTLASIDLKMGDEESATHYYLLSVLNDLQHGIAETVAIRELSSLLFYSYHDAYKASDYLTVALQNAQFFGTRYRVNNMGTLLPVFEGQKQLIENNRKMIMIWTILIILVLVIFLMFILRLNIKNSKILSVSRENLRKSNLKLDEANRIKNQYLGHYMDLVSETAVEINQFALLAEQKLKMNQEAAVGQLIKNLKAKYNKKVIKDDFDKAFMFLFPTFIEDFNALMTEASQQMVDDKEVLTPVLRIFALVRLGITDNNQIAKVLDYSFNTVYNYRIRTRNKAKDPEQFENDIAKIGL